MSFKESIKHGKTGEKIVCDFLESKNILFSLNTSNKLKNLTKWDIEITLNGVAIGFEVKFDMMASKTGNMAIEFYNTKLDKPSGINATEAKLWVVVLGDQGYVCSVSRLKDFIKDNKPLRTILNGGDKNAALYLYKLEKIMPIFRLLDKDLPDEFLLNESNWEPR